MYEVFLKTRSDEFLIDRLKFGAGPAGLPTPVPERDAAVRVSRFMRPSLNQTFSTETHLKLLVVDIFLGFVYIFNQITQVKAIVKFEDLGLGLAEVSHRYAKNRLGPVRPSSHRSAHVEENMLTLKFAQLVHRNENPRRDQESIDIFPLLNRALSQKTCLGSVHSLDMVSKLAILPQTGNTDSEIIIQSVGVIRCVDSVFPTFDDGKANAMTQGKQLQCSKSVFPPQALPSRVVFYVESQDNCRRKKVRRHISQLLSDPKRDLLTPNYRYPWPTCRSWQSI